MLEDRYNRDCQTHLHEFDVRKRKWLFRLVFSFIAGTMLEAKLEVTPVELLDGYGDFECLTPTRFVLMVVNDAPIIIQGRHSTAQVYNTRYRPWWVKKKNN